MRDLRRIRDTNNQTTACTIATSLIHSKTETFFATFRQYLTEIVTNNSIGSFLEICFAHQDNNN